VVFIHPQWLATTATKKMIVPLDDRMKKDNTLKLNDLFAGSMAYYQFPIGGKQHGLPFYSGPSMCLFNRSLCKQLGVQAPDELQKAGTWTWDAARDSAVATTKTVGGQKVWGWEGTTTGLHFLNIIVWGFGGEYWDKDFTKCLMGEAGTVDALQRYADLSAKYNTVPTSEENNALANSKGGRIVSGRIAAKYGIKGNVPDIALWADQSGTEVGMAPMPNGPKGYFVRNGPNSYTIPAGTKHPDAVYDLISFMVGDEIQALNLKVGGSTPPRKSQADALFAKNLHTWENLAMWKQAMEVDKPLPMAATHSDIQKLFDTEYKKVIAGAQTMKRAAEALVPQVTDLLKQAKALQSG
jgi:multiple sugar transport system substrate-binding protein